MVDINNEEIDNYYPEENYPRIRNPKTNNSLISQQKTNKNFLWLIIIPFIVIVLAMCLCVIFSQKTISEHKFSQGTTFDLKEKQEITFTLYEEEHSVKVNSVDNNSINIILQSKPINFNIKIGEEKKFDLNNDSFFDIIIKLNKITNGIPELYIKQINESSCIINWNCGNWTNCFINGTQTRICTDLNSCGTNLNKPLIIQNCNYTPNNLTNNQTDNRTCISNWSCGNWTNCFINGTQTRICIDKNNCTNQTNKPQINSSCNINISEIDCGNGLNACFINATRNCSKARSIFSGSLDLFGFNFTSSSLYRIIGLEKNYCNYSSQILNISVNFTQELINSLLAQNKTMEEIREAERNTSLEAQNSSNVKTTCKGNSTELAIIFVEIATGNTKVSSITDISGSNNTYTINNKNYTIYCKNELVN